MTTLWPEFTIDSQIVAKIYNFYPHVMCVTLSHNNINNSANMPFLTNSNVLYNYSRKRMVSTP